MRKGAKRDLAAWSVVHSGMTSLPEVDRRNWGLGVPSFFSVNADDLGPLERAREGGRGSGTANPGCRVNESLLGDQESGTILVGKDQLLAKTFYNTR
ncbi:hypothetical protein H0G86_000355 [Trichoderma simmonsii]|uniref:Uncharacterized protein n=1 Tax=Trichoderma simmonsii TaxID=1491479 RepID=A0A8G0L2I9_9HYPO|nr:hypothetical protein H0G86_000355 [Trichoderma simmonsii]